VESSEVTSLPSDSNGYITFGSFNVLTKITPDMLAIWGRLLAQVPEARLLIKNRQLTDERLKSRLGEHFRGMGINSERIELLGRTSKSEHMATYGRVDIALDSYPYNGTTTTCDTLWMGIPVVTLAGSCHVSRVGVSILSQIGLDELVTESSME
jgi:predicted O-linked N-acetylglucosamine transferase (SPINDLY family)